MLESFNIRALCKNDLPMLLEWRNHPEVRQFMFTQHEIGVEEHASWFARASLDAGKKLFVVEENKQAIGYVQFSLMVNESIANWGFYIRPNSPKGTGLNLGVIALDYAFRKLKLHKVCGQVIEGNVISISFHQRLGFILEGVLREQQIIEGIYRNTYCLGLLANEWDSKKIMQEHT